MRIEIPDNPDEFIQLAKAISAQHTKLGAASPLNNIKGIATLAPLAASADSANALANQLYEQAKTATEARDNAIGSDVKTPGTLKYLATAARDVLAATNKGTEHRARRLGLHRDRRRRRDLREKGRASRRQGRQGQDRLTADRSRTGQRHVVPFLFCREVGGRLHCLRAWAGKLPAGHGEELICLSVVR